MVDRTQPPEGLKVALVGGGAASLSVMHLLDSPQLSRLRLQVVGLADPDPDAEALAAARARGIFATTDHRELLQLPGLRLVIELTGRREVLDQVRPLPA